MVSPRHGAMISGLKSLLNRLESMDTMKYPFLDRYADGSIRYVNDYLWSLCGAYNNATNPALPMTDHEYHRSRQYARAIKGRMARLGYTYGNDYVELSNGMLWPSRSQWRVASDETAV